MTTTAQAYAALRSVGATPTQASLLTAIGEAESGLNPAAVGDVALENGTWGPSVGVWQQRTLKADTGKGTARDVRYLTGDLQHQAAAALATLKSQGPTAWSTYSNKSYLAYTGSASTGAQAANAAYAQNGSWGSILGGILGGLALPGGGGSSLGGVLGGAGGDLAGSVGGSVAGSVASSLWSSIQPFALTALFALGGVALVVVGMTVLTKPVRDEVKGEATQAASMAAMVA